MNSIRHEMRTAVYAGSFDPVTLGHLDIIHRASKIFERLMVTVFHNSSKSPLFSVDERTELLRRVTADMPNVEIDSSNDLLIRYMEKNNAKVIVRALRSVSDYEFELQIASMNQKLDKDVETLFMISSPQYSYLSSSIVKEIAKFHGPVSDLVPDVVEQALKSKYGKA